MTSRVVIQKVDLTESGNLVSFGLDKEYKEIPYDATTKERFLLRRAELPEEIPVVKYKTPKGKYELYVSNDGSDENKGTIDKPFKTLAHAVNVAKITPNSDGIVICLREGVYEFLSTEILKGLKGNADNPIFISAYPGEEVKFIAAYKLDNSQFKPVTDGEKLERLDKNVRDTIRVIDLKEQGIDYVPAINGEQMGSALFMDGNTFNIARYPNTGYAKVEQVVDEGPVKYINEQINPNYYNDGRGFTIGLVNDKEPLSWKDTGDIWVRGGFRYEWYQVYTPIKIDYENSSFNSRGAESVHGVKAGSDFWYYNVFEELNMPGEYYIVRDQDELKLYLYPIGDIKSNSNIFLSVATGSLMNVTDCKNLIISDINFEAGTKEAVVLNDCEDVVFQRCNFQNFGSNQAVFKTSKRCGFTSCKFVEFGDRAFYTGTGMNIDKIGPFNNFIQNCAINGNKDQILHSMTSFSGVGEIASHNLYTNGYATGAGTGGWEGIVEYNEFVASPKYQLDSGGTYGGGSTGVRGYHIRYNYIHDILPNSTNQLTRGIYVDVMGSDTLIYGNIMYKIPAGIFAHGGRDHTYFNNISVALNSPSSFAAANSLNMFNPAPSETILSRTQYIRPTEAIKSRYPNYYKWLLVRNKVADDFNNAEGNYVRGDEWNEVFAPINFYYANNVSALGGGKFLYSTSVDWDQTEGLNTNFTTNNDPFVDLENRNFNIRKDADIYTAIPDFEAPNFDNMGLLIGKDYMERKPYMGEYGDIFAFSPADGDVGAHNASKVEFLWTDVMWANRYRLEIATDKNFDNVVYDKTIEYEYETITNLQPNTTYYWRVTATTLSKSVDPTPLYSKVFTFTTAK